MLNFLKERRTTIEEGLKKSELAEKQFKEFREMQAHELAKTRREAQQIIEAAKKRATEAKDQILEEAKLETEILFRRAEKDIDALKNQRLLDAERELGSMAVLGMEYLLREKISQEKKSQFADEAISKIKNLQFPPDPRPAGVRSNMT